MTRLIDADALSELVGEPIEVFLSRLDLRLPPTVEAIPISFIEEQAKLCNEIGFRRGEECYMALIEDWREKNGTETD